MSGDDSQRAYVAGLTMLSRRELSERQLRERLRRREYDDAAIDTAVVRLKEQRSLDDTRVAHALARQEVLTKHHGRLRAQRQLEQIGISASLTRATLDEVFADLDQDALLAAALARRLRGDRPIEDEHEFRRLYRYLMAQGFESDRVVMALKARRRP